MSWSPNTDGVKKIVSLLQGTERCSNEEHKKLYYQLQDMQKHAEFSAYLCHIFVITDKNNNNKSMKMCRQQAGLLLKNSIKRSWDKTPNNIKMYIQNNILRALTDEEIQIRKYCSAAVGMILLRGGLNCWQSLVPSLLQGLQAKSLHTVHGALLCLDGLCQGQQTRYENEGDKANTLDTCDVICAHDKSTQIVQLLITYMIHKNLQIRCLSLDCLNALC
eukprot:UN30935